MRTTRLSLLTALVAVSICASIASGGAPMGPPAATLGEGKWSIGAEAGHEQMDLEATGIVRDYFANFFWTQRFEIEDLTSTMAFVDLAYGVCDNWNIFVRVGAADASDDIVIPAADATALERRDSFDGDFGLAWGVGTRATFCRWGEWSFGGLVQVTWFEPGDSSFDIEDPFIPAETWSGDVELSYWQTQVSLAAVYDGDPIRVWGGPFLQFITGDMDFNGQAALAGGSGQLKWSGDLNESSQIGVHVGASLDVTEQWNLWVEGQMTGDSWLIGIGTAIVPESYGL